MQYVPDMFTVVKDFGILAAVLIIVVYFFIKYTIGQATKVKGEHDEAVRNIKDVTFSMGAILNGQKEIMSHILNGQKEIVNTIENRCGSTSCPIIPIITTKMEKIDKLERSVAETAERVEDFVSELGREMLINLRERSRTDGIKSDSGKND